MGVERLTNQKQFIVIFIYQIIQILVINIYAKLVTTFSNTIIEKNAGKFVISYKNVQSINSNIISKCKIWPHLIYKLVDPLANITNIYYWLNE